MRVGEPVGMAVRDSVPSSDNVGEKSAKRLIVPTFDGKIVQPKIKKS